MTTRLKVLVLALVALLAIGTWQWLRRPRPGAGTAEYLAAVQAREEGDLEAAASRLRSAILLEPGNGGYHAELGDLYLRRGQSDTAAAELEMAAHLVPGRPHVYCLLAQALVEERRRTEALAALDVALRKAPDCPHALSVRGEQLLRDDNLRDSLAAFRKVIQLQRDFPLAYQKAGYILLETSQPEEALRVLHRGLALAPEQPGTHFLIGQAHLKQSAGARSLELAETHLRLALQNNPEAGKVHAALGQVYVEKRDPRKAREHFEEAVRLTPNSPEALYGLSRLAENQGRTAQATLYLRRFQRMQAVERRVSDLSAQAAGERDNVDLHLRMARLSLDQGMLKEAERALEAAVRIDPARREARELRARLYLEQGRTERARRESTLAGRLPRGSR